MIIRLHKGDTITGALRYNFSKEQGEVADMLEAVNMPNVTDYETALCYFKDMLSHNDVKDPVFTVSVSPALQDLDSLSDDDYRAIASRYMEGMGYGEQPYLVFKHRDIERTHLHIVSVRVDAFGRRIADSYERTRSARLRRAIEQEWNLTKAEDQRRDRREAARAELEFQERSKAFAWQGLSAGQKDLRKALRSTLRYVEKFHYTDLKTYNHVLSLYNIEAETVKAERGGYEGIFYYVTTPDGRRMTAGIKGSEIGREFSLPKFRESLSRKTKTRKAEDVKKDRDAMKRVVNGVLRKGVTLREMTELLRAEGVTARLSYAKDGRLFGVTFISSVTGAVFKGSELGKEYSASAILSRLRAEGEGRAATTEERKAMQQTLRDIYAGLRKDKTNYYYESLLIGDLDRHRKTMIERLEREHQEVGIRDIMSAVNYFIERKAGSLESVADKEHSLFDAKVRSMSSYMSYLDPTLRRRYLQAVNLDIDGGEIFSSRRPTMRMSLSAIGLDEHSFGEDLGGTGHERPLSTADRSVIDAAVSGQLDGYEFTSYKPYLRALDFLREEDRKRALRRMTAAEVTARVGECPDIRQAVEVLLEKGFIIRPATDASGRQGYAVCNYRGGEDEAVMLTEETSRRLDAIGYGSRGYASAMELVFRKDGKPNSRYDIIVSLSRAMEAEDGARRDSAVGRVFDRIAKSDSALSAKLRECYGSGGGMQEMARIIGPWRPKTTAQKRKYNGI